MYFDNVFSSNLKAVCGSGKLVCGKNDAQLLHLVQIKSMRVCPQSLLLLGDALVFISLNPSDWCLFASSHLYHALCKLHQLLTVTSIKPDMSCALCQLLG